MTTEAATDPSEIRTVTCWRCGSERAALWRDRVACACCGLFWSPLPRETRVGQDGR
jgi:ribosomal protein L37E